MRAFVWTLHEQSVGAKNCVPYFSKKKKKSVCLEKKNLPLIHTHKQTLCRHTHTHTHTLFIHTQTRFAHAHEQRPLECFSFCITCLTRSIIVINLQTYTHTHTHTLFHPSILPSIHPSILCSSPCDSAVPHRCCS